MTPGVEPGTIRSLSPGYDREVKSAVGNSEKRVPLQL
jgi:hypothetical protein